MLDLGGKEYDKTGIRVVRAQDARQFNFVGPNKGEEYLKTLFPIADMGGGEMLLLEDGAGNTYGVRLLELQPGAKRDQKLAFYKRGGVIACYNGMTLAALVAPVSNLAAIFNAMGDIAARAVAETGDCALV